MCQDADWNADEMADQIVQCENLVNDNKRVLMVKHVEGDSLVQQASNVKDKAEPPMVENGMGKGMGRQI